jgi:hypothetical protein
MSDLLPKLILEIEDARARIARAIVEEEILETQEAVRLLALIHLREVRERAEADALAQSIAVDLAAMRELASAGEEDADPGLPNVQAPSASALDTLIAEIRLRRRRHSVERSDEARLFAILDQLF